MTLSLNFLALLRPLRLLVHLRPAPAVVALQGEVERSHLGVAVLRHGPGPAPVSSGSGQRLALASVQTLREQLVATATTNVDMRGLEADRFVQLQIVIIAVLVVVVEGGRGVCIELEWRQRRTRPPSRHTRINHVNIFPPTIPSSSALELGRQPRCPLLVEADPRLQLRPRHPGIAAPSPRPSLPLPLLDLVAEAAVETAQEYGSYWHREDNPHCAAHFPNMIGFFHDDGCFESSKIRLELSTACYKPESDHALAINPEYVTLISTTNCGYVL